MKPIEWQLKTIHFGIIEEFEHNPRVLSKHDYKHLKESLNKFGLIDKPILNLKDDGYVIIGGHQRVKILEDQGLQFIECWIPNRELDEKEFKELNLRLNRNHASFNYDQLANNFNVYDLLEWGFDEKELHLDLDCDFQEESNETQQDFKCPTCGKKSKKKIED